MPGGWAGSDRRERLPPDWRRIVARILARDNHQCQAPKLDGTLCLAPATQVDHIVPGDDHRDENLQALCRWHHGRKSSAEGNAARTRPPTNRRPTERHPGLR
jgi:5-methylcytosine-specific restriction enzyme A